jgi:uncharacterized protein YbjQ (UPF0145 family)
MLFASCASTSFSNFSEFPLIESGNLPSDRYIVMGTVSGASNLTMTAEEYNKLIKNEFAYEPQNVQVKFVNDSGDYGFIGKPVNIKMNVFERSVALAEYKMIQTAKHNQADAIVFLKSNTTVETSYKTTFVKTVVSGYAVRIKPDSGYTIEVPVEEVPAPEAETETEEPEVPEVTESE